MNACIKEKVQFVKELSAAVTKVQKNIEDISYRVLRKGESEREYLVITYDGGAQTVRNCTANSCGAIFEEIAEYLFSGYYAETSEFYNMLRDGWVEEQ